MYGWYSVFSTFFCASGSYLFPDYRFSIKNLSYPVIYACYDDYLNKLFGPYPLVLVAEGISDNLSHFLIRNFTDVDDFSRFPIQIFVLP